MQAKVSRLRVECAALSGRGHKLLEQLATRRVALDGETLAFAKLYLWALERDACTALSTEPGRREALLSETLNNLHAIVVDLETYLASSRAPVIVA